MTKEELNEKAYEELRTAHSRIKDLLDLLSEMTPQQRNAIEALHLVFYLAEEHFTDF